MFASRSLRPLLLTSQTQALRSWGSSWRLLSLFVFWAAPALAQTCYRLPFSNPDLADGWGSTCCGRTNPHRGVDFPQATGTPIPAVAAGVVVLKTVSGCLGNVVVIQHGDGMFSGYSHMSAQSPLAVGTGVSIGQIVGKVGNTGTCSFGAHLHLTMAPTVGGYASGATVDPYNYIVAHLTCVPPNTAPRGAFDAATCSGISGWAQDPNAGAAPINARVSIGGPTGAPGAQEFNLRADLNRPDLCVPIGSCAHGFSMGVPLNYFDGVDHSVSAYAIDSAGGANTLLGTKTIHCDSAPLPKFEAGLVRRLIPDLGVMTAWKLTKGDIAPLDDTLLEAIPLGPALSAAPVLVRANGDVYVAEYGGVRHVPSPAVMTAWTFGPFAEVTPEEVAAAVHGAAWPSTPFLARGTSKQVYLLDAPPPLWAELISSNLPKRMNAATSLNVTFTFKNRGSLAWNSDVVLAPTPRDDQSALCDPTWPSCSRVAALGAVAPGAEGSVTFRLLAPARAGDVNACFGLVRGKVWFSEAGQNGPADDAICQTIQVVAAGSTPPQNIHGGAGPDAGLATGGCAQAGGSLWPLFGLALLFTPKPRRRRRDDNRTAGF